MAFFFFKRNSWILPLRTELDFDLNSLHLIMLKHYPIVVLFQSCTQDVFQVFNRCTVVVEVIHLSGNNFCVITQIVLSINMYLAKHRPKH